MPSPSVLDGVTAAPGTTPAPAPRPAPRRRKPASDAPAKPAAAAKTAAAKAPAAKPAPAKAPKRTGIPVLPIRGKIAPDAAELAGVSYIVKAVDTPWEAGAIRVIRCAAAEVRKPGSKVDLAHSKTGQWLGTYAVVGSTDEKKCSVWAVQQAAAASE